MRKGTRVLVKWWDITADLHTDVQLDPVLAESVGWVPRDTKKVLELAYSRYKDKSGVTDKIAIVKGCIESVEEI